MNDKVKWTFGVQLNKVPDVKLKTIPRLGMIYQLNDRSGIKVNYGQAFRAAYGVETHFDLVICCREDGSNKGGLRGNSSLEPEIITTYDIQYFNTDQNSQLNLTLFYSQQEDLIERERAPDRVLDFINRGELMVKGVELEYEYIFHPNSQLFGSFTYQKNESKAGLENITLAPNYMFKFGFSYLFEQQFSRDIKLSMFNSYFDDAHDNIIRSPNRKEVNPLAKNYNMLTVNINFPLNIESFSASQNAYIELYGYNLLNEDIYQPEVAGGQINTNPLRSGRSWYLSFTLNY